VLCNVLFARRLLVVWFVDAAEASAGCRLAIVMDDDFSNVCSRGVEHLSGKLVLKGSSGESAIDRNDETF
jgi:hypothetical protein